MARPIAILTDRTLASRSLEWRARQQVEDAATEAAACLHLRKTLSILQRQLGDGAGNLLGNLATLRGLFVAQLARSGEKPRAIKRLADQGLLHALAETLARVELPDAAILKAPEHRIHDPCPPRAP